ncbi:MAG TPA: molybdenum cofactor synthesis domain-containing protein [Bacteroidales bacterium]|nr:molybdenum cofactor synthesis domain-containing protein [Bacteroidales bacterium]
MNFPEKFEVIIITLSDRAAKGEYKDLSGPRISDMLTDYFRLMNWDNNITLKIIPDDGVMLSDLLIYSFVRYNIIITTGGTGIGPRDITVDTVLPLLTKEIPGVMDYIRVKYGADNPGALLSRGVAGIAGKSLIYTLPGSVKAVEEYMTEILRTLRHTLEMQYGVDTHKKH